MMESLKDRKILLIGGAGFIGHSLALRMKKRGADVSIVDSLQVNNLATFATHLPEFLNRDLYLRIIHERLNLIEAAGIPLYIQDARDYHAVGKIIVNVEPQVVVHLAAVAHAGKSNKDPYSTFDHSLRTLENALDVARGKVQQFIFLSSSMVYGDFQTDSITEDHPLNPIGIYGALKVAGEKMVIAYQQVFDLAYTIIRPSALYGERCVSRRVGQIFIENAFAGQKLMIEGDGDERLDFTYINDLVDGICLAVVNPAARNQIFNMTYGKSRSIKEMVDTIRAEFPAVEIVNSPRDRLMPRRGTLSTDRAGSLLGYAPQYPLERGMVEYIAWYKRLLGTTSASRLTPG